MIGVCQITQHAKWKNMKVVINMEIIPDKMNFMEISRCVRSAHLRLFFFPPNSLTANLKPA